MAMAVASVRAVAKEACVAEVEGNCKHNTQTATRLDTRICYAFEGSLLTEVVLVG